MGGLHQHTPATLVEWQRMGQEQPHRREIEVELVTAYAGTFIPRWDRYPVQMQQGKYIQLPYLLTLDTVSAHLTDYRYPDRQPVTIGAYALDEKSQAKWVCFDADDPDQWNDLLGMAANLQNSGIPGYLEQSRRGGTFGYSQREFQALRHDALGINWRMSME